MKTRIMMLMLAGILTITSAFASGTNIEVNRRIQTSFSTKFANATEISWSRSEHYVKASFRVDNQFLFAYYLENGELIGVSRNLTSTQLPMLLKNSLKQNYGSEWITELFEFATEDQTIYIATVENGDEKMMIKSTDARSWELVHKTKKP